MKIWWTEPLQDCRQVAVVTVDSLALSLSLFSKRGCSRSALEEEQGDGTSLACLPHELATFSPSKNSIQAVPISMIYIYILTSCAAYTQFCTIRNM